MSVLRRGDEDMHYSDNSHRWIAPPDVDQSAWDAGLRAHLSQHLSTVGGPARSEEPRPPHLMRHRNSRVPEPKSAAMTPRRTPALPKAPALPKGAAA
ncbi:MAG TPA: hypothetical protein VFB84_06380 [Micromonosporaceae bacterium]|nr:hypothetical protein [Micromonosporaceae bacterium]